MGFVLFVYKRGLWPVKKAERVRGKKFGEQKLRGEERKKCRKIEEKVERKVVVVDRGEGKI